MEHLTDFIIAGVAFLGVTLIAFGLFGRPSHAQPCCVGCGADARPQAWSEAPRCGCGAALDRPGAVRSKGRVRRPRLALLGLALWLAAVAITGETIRLRMSDRSWIAWLPSNFVVGQAIRGHSWAQSIWEGDDLTPAIAGETLRIAYGSEQSAIAIPADLLFGRWLETRDEAASTIRIMSESIVPVSRVEGNECICVLEPGLPMEERWAFRIERVEHKGQPLEWRLAAHRPPKHANAGRRAFVVCAELHITLPASIAPADEVEIVLTTVMAPGAIGLALDPNMNGDEPPTTPVEYATVVENRIRFVPITVGGRS